MKHHSQAGSHRSRAAHCARLLGDRGTARRRRSDLGRAHAEGAHPQHALVPLASHGAPVPQALRLEGHDRRRVDAGLQGAAGRVRLRPRHGGRDSRASRRTGQGHGRAAPRAARSRAGAIRASATSHRFTGSGRRRACRTIRISPTVDGTTQLPYEWSFLSTHVDRALDITKGDPHVVVGVIDTGVAHVPDLAGKIDSIWTVHGTGRSCRF